jgi:tetratricopeptide (TPR) repeat protein
MAKKKSITANPPQASLLTPSPSYKANQLGSTALHLAVIALIGLLAYANTFHVPFVFDDNSSITNNPAIKDLPTFLSGAGYAHNPRRFIGYLSFALNYKLGGLNVVGYHLVNLAIHIITAWLVYVLASLTLRTPYFDNREQVNTVHRSLFTDYRSFLPLFAALLFVAHPIQTQAVTYIVQRLASLATLFYVLALVFYIKGRLANPAKPFSLHSVLFFTISLIAALLAMRTKEIAATLPLVVVLYEFSFFGAGTRKKLLFLLPLLLILLIIPLGMLHTGQPLGELLSDVSEMARETRVISRGDYLLTQFSVIATYIRLLFLPINQNLDYDYPVYDSLFALPVLGGCILICSFIGLAIYFYYRTRQVSPFTVHRSPFTAVHRLIAFGILWFFITLTVESSIIPISDVIYEHRLYLPSVGAFIALAALTALISRRFSSRLFMTVAMMMVIILATATWRRNVIWGDLQTFWMDIVEKSPNKNRPHNNLGKTYLGGGRTTEALEEFKTAVRLNPDNPLSRYNLGTAYDSVGLTDAAIEQFLAAIKLKEDYADAHDNLGLSYGKKGLFDKAIEEFKLALRLTPDYASTHSNLALAYRLKGSLGEAVAEYQIALKLQPGNADAHNNLGVVYWQMHQPDKAIEEVRAAVRLAPDNEEFRRNLARMNQIKGAPQQRL